MMYVVHSKAIVPLEDFDVLDIGVGMICRNVPNVAVRTLKRKNPLHLWRRMLKQLVKNPLSLSVFNLVQNMIYIYIYL